MDIDRTNLERLQAEMEAAIDAHNKVLRRRREREDILREEMRKVLEAEFGVELTAAAKVRSGAELACKTEADRIRKLESEASLPHPIGTVLKEWTWRCGWSGRASDARLTGKVAVLEIFKEGDEVPANVRWGKPSVGAIVLRMLKMDGSRGKDVEAWTATSDRIWFPEGQKPVLP